MVGCMPLALSMIFVPMEVPAEDRQLAPVPGWYEYAKGEGLENVYGIDGI
jgi:hypothetical protein